MRGTQGPQWCQDHSTFTHLKLRFTNSTPNFWKVFVCKILPLLSESEYSICPIYISAKEIFHAATHAHYVRRHLTDKDWDFFSDQLTLALTDTTKFDELKDFIMGGEKLSKFLCTICSVLIPGSFETKIIKCG